MPPAGPPPVPWGPPEAAGPRIGEGALRFSHSGERYILGYGADFFGIWDRSIPGEPVSRFPRTDEGWDMAWNQFTAWEPRAMQVPQYGTPPDVRISATPFRSAHALSQWVVVLLALTVVSLAVGIVFQYMELRLAERADGGELVSASELQASDDRIGALGIISLFVAIPTIVLWLVWQYRAQSNLYSLGVSGLKYRPGWVVGWWFIPAANFVMPFRTMKEQWQASDPERGTVDWKLSAPTFLLWTWWLCWPIGFSILSGVALTFTTEAFPPPHDFVVRDYFLIGANILSILAAVAAIYLVRGIGERQEAKRRRVSAMTPGGLPSGGRYGGGQGSW